MPPLLLVPLREQEADANVRTGASSVKYKDEIASAQVKVQQEVKEEFESVWRGSRAAMPATSQAPRLETGGPVSLRLLTQIEMPKKSFSE